MNSRQHRLVPEGATTFDASEGVNDAKRQDALDRTRHNAESQSLGVVLIPSLHIECEESYDSVSEGPRTSARINLHANMTNIVFQDWPRFIAAPNSRTSRQVLSASTP